MIAPPNFNPPYWDSTAKTPRFDMGKRVRVRSDLPESARPGGHLRTPWSVRGKTGVVERVCGHFENPESLAYHGDGLPKQPLYRVRFALSDLWGEEAASGFAAQDTLDVEIYEHWLEPFFDYGGDPAAERAKVERDLAGR